MAKILIVVDDHAEADGLVRSLVSEGFDVSTARSEHDGLERACGVRPDAVVLTLPLGRGLEACRRLRDGVATRSLPIILVTAHAEEADQLLAFATGVDDYVMKPYAIRILVARIEKQLRRQVPASTNLESVIESQGVVLDRRRHRAYQEGRELTLSPTEFRLLQILLRQPGRAFARNELVEAAIGEDVIVLERTIDVHIKSLRRKLGESAPLIETVRSVGYRFREPAFAMP